MKGKLNEVEFDVIAEELVSLSNEITEYAVEDNSAITDHIRPNPTRLNITGVLVGENAANKLETLRRYSRQGEVLNYINRNSIKDVIIRNLDTRHNARVRNGLEFVIELQQIRFVEAETVALATPIQFVQFRKVQNAGTKQASQKEVLDDRLAEIIRKAKQAQ